MKKYQKDGKYVTLKPHMFSGREVAIIKVIPKEMRGKYKIGQQWAPAYRLKMARNIIKKEGKEQAKAILDIMEIEILADGNLRIKREPLM